MGTPFSPVSDLGLLALCDVVEVRSRGHLQCRGIVEATAPHSGVVWVRDGATGDRMMLHGAAHDVVRLSIGFPPEAR